MLNAATKANLERKAFYVDHVQTRDGVPMFSWVELSITELCNMKCPFCPRADGAEYPNQPLHMSLALARKIATELRANDYEGAVVLCGFGEPLLHPQLVEIVRAFGDIRVEIVTNGKTLTPTLIADLIGAGLDYFVVSMYEGPHQVDDFHARFAEAECPSDRYALRDRWYGADQDYGLKLTNRAGAINIGNQQPIDAKRSCWYPSYQMMIDWNGDVLLCPQDWVKRIKFGNVSAQSLWDVWTSKVMTKRRMHLLRNREGISPCSGCNSDGQMHGMNHAAAWVGR